MRQRILRKSKNLKFVAIFIIFFALIFGSIIAIQSAAESLGIWKSTTSYPIAVEAASCFTSSGYVYCVGGDNGTAYATNGVYYAPVNSSGVGSWKSTTSYPTNTTSQSCVTSSGYVYCVGGMNEFGYDTNATYYAMVNSSGIGSWTSTASYPTVIDSQGCVASSGYIYCVGGYSGVGDTNAVYYATLSSSGGIVGNWTPTSSYPIKIIRSGCVASSGYVYCIGGFNGTRVKNVVNYASLSSSGVGSWSSTTSYPTAVQSQGCVASSVYIYCVAGANGTGFVNAVYYASSSNTGGIVGNWTTTASYPIAGEYNSCVTSTGYIYCVAGYDPTGYMNAVYYSQISSPTTTTSSSTSTTFSTTSTTSPITSISSTSSTSSPISSTISSNSSSSSTQSTTSSTTSTGQTSNLYLIPAFATIIIVVGAVASLIFYRARRK